MDTVEKLDTLTGEPLIDYQIFNSELCPKFLYLGFVPVLSSQLEIVPLATVSL